MYVPKIKAKGIYRLSEPFASKLADRVPYTCISVRSIEDMLLSKIDVLEAVYTKNNLPKSTYEADLKNGALIVTLQSDTGKAVIVPTTYITGYPELGGVNYVPFILALNLGYLPKNIDVTHLTDKLKSDVMDYIGVTSSATLVVSGEENILTDSEHEALFSQRQQNITAKKTDYAKLLEMTIERDRLLQECEKYKRYIKDRLPGP